MADSTAFVTRFRKGTTVRIRLPAQKFLNMKLMIENSFSNKEKINEFEKFKKMINIGKRNLEENFFFIIDYVDILKF